MLCVVEGAWLVVVVGGCEIQQVAGPSASRLWRAFFDRARMGWDCQVLPGLKGSQRGGGGLIRPVMSLMGVTAATV